MNEEKKQGFAIVISNPSKENDKESQETQGITKADKKESSEKLEFSLADFGGYTPSQLVSKLEEARDSIVKGNAKEATAALDGCIVRISGKKLPEENNDSAVNEGLRYELDKAFS
jgi:hypothetical protein